MVCISLPTALLIGGGLTAAGGVASGIIGSKAAKSAAQTQASAANTASQNQLAMFADIKEMLKPYVDSGAISMETLARMIGANEGGNPLTAPLTAPFQPTMDQLRATPGYQFTEQQGLRAVQNSFAAKGLGSSGPAVRGGIDYAEQLASTTYQQQFENYLKQNQQIYNMLGGVTSTGLQAGGAVAGAGMNTTALSNQALMGGASATAAGKIGSANALTSGITAATSGLSNTAMLLGMNASGMFDYSKKSGNALMPGSSSFIGNPMNYLDIYGVNA